MGKNLQKQNERRIKSVLLRPIAAHILLINDRNRYIKIEKWKLLENEQLRAAKKKSVDRKSVDIWKKNFRIERMNDSDNSRKLPHSLSIHAMKCVCAWCKTKQRVQSLQKVFESLSKLRRTEIKNRAHSTYSVVRFPAYNRFDDNSPSIRELKRVE